MRENQNNEWWQDAIEKVKGKMEWVSEKSREKNSLYHGERNP